MRISQSRGVTNRTALAMLSLVPLVCVFLVYKLAPVIPPEPNRPYPSIEVGKQKVIIPTWQLFETGDIWSLTNNTSRIPNNFYPQLVETPVEHWSKANQVSLTIAKPLKAMFEQAKLDGVNLMVSEAFRTAERQQEIFDGMTALHGRSYAESAVAVPGASEHQVGLAIDLSNINNACLQHGESCGLDATAINWLRFNAPKYGFIERYPAGKQSITGVIGEHWHYRYVGSTLAKAISEENFTLDEFVQQSAPGYAK